MPTELDRTQQRIVGVLIEKELAVPESYPLTEKALHAGCNQKSNRDPEMSLEQFELMGALNALMTADWVKLPYELLGTMSSRIINEVSGINRVVYDISSKPPATAHANYDCGLQTARPSNPC